MSCALSFSLGRGHPNLNSQNGRILPNKIGESSHCHRDLTCYNRSQLSVQRLPLTLAAGTKEEHVLEHHVCFPGLRMASRLFSLDASPLPGQTPTSDPHLMPSQRRGPSPTHVTAVNRVPPVLTCAIWPLANADSDLCMEEVLMSEPFEPTQEHSESHDQSHGVDRRAVLRRGAKLAYIAPVVIIAMKAQESAAVVSPGPSPSPT
jgi:hypothetical protein